MKNPITKKFIPGLFIAAALLATPAIATLSVGEKLGANEEAIKTKLEAQGYVVMEIEKEDNMLEVEVTLNGKEFELEVDPKSGAIIKIEEEEKDD